MIMVSHVQSKYTIYSLKNPEKCVSFFSSFLVKSPQNYVLS